MKLWPIYQMGHFSDVHNPANVFWTYLFENSVGGWTLPRAESGRCKLCIVTTHDQTQKQADNGDKWYMLLWEKFKWIDSSFLVLEKPEKHSVNRVKLQQEV